MLTGEAINKRTKNTHFARVSVYPLEPQSKALDVLLIGFEHIHLTKRVCWSSNLTAIVQFPKILMSAMTHNALITLFYCARDIYTNSSS